MKVSRTVAIRHSASSRLKLHCRRVSLFYHRILQNAVVASTKDATGKKGGGELHCRRAAGNVANISYQCQCG